MSDKLMQLKGLVKHYEVGGGIFSRMRKKPISVVHAVDGVDLEIFENETLAVVGETGSGKTTLGLAAVRLIEPTSGEVVFRNVDLTRLGAKELRKLRKFMQVVFQDPTSSLDPRQKVVDIVGEPLKVIGEEPSSNIRSRVIEAVNQVGLNETQIDLYPHQFSGGQRQRINIARAIVVKPKFIVLDEPTSQLDASVQAQVLLLLKRLQVEFSLTYLLITHNMSVARYLADRIAVMYLGKIVETGPNEDILSKPLHPYTQLLISSILEPGLHSELKRDVDEIETPSSVNLPSGCRFRTVCRYAKERCAAEEPELRLLIGRHVACHFAEEINRLGNNQTPGSLIPSSSG